MDRTFFKGQLKIADYFRNFPRFIVLPKIPPPIHPVLSAAYLQTIRDVKLWLRFSFIPPLRPHPCLKPFTILVCIVLPAGGNFSRLTQRGPTNERPDIHLCVRTSASFDKKEKLSFKTVTESISQRPHVLAWGQIHICRWIWLKNLGKTLQHWAMSMASSTEK